MHDTLLQSVNALVMMFHTATQEIPQSEPSRKKLEAALDQSDQVIAEGRARVLDLRLGSTEIDLTSAFKTVASDLSQLYSATFSVIVNGGAREMHPVVQDEVYCIGREAITNAFNHAFAQKIEAEMTFDTTGFCLKVRDNGRGIAADILENGRGEGHWGMHGMRERSRKIGGRLDVWTRSAAGTEIELRIPAGVAFRDSLKAARWMWLRRLLGSRPLS